MLVDGSSQIQFKTKLKIALVSVPASKISDILLSTQKMDTVLVTIPQMDALMTISGMTTMLIASSRVIVI